MTAQEFTAQLKKVYTSELQYTYDIAFETIPDTARKSVTYSFWNGMPWQIINIPALVDVLIHELANDLQSHDAWLLDNKRPKVTLTKNESGYFVSIETYVIYYQLETTANWLELLGYEEPTI